jgi:small subunit ribosomal protein S16
LAAKIKLQRKGTKSRPFYRVVVQNAATARDGDVIDTLGQYDPLKEPSAFTVDIEKTKAWLGKGAEPTEKLRILLGKAGILPPVDTSLLTKRKPKGEQKAEEGAETKTEVKAEAPAEEKKEEVKGATA